ncbi:N-acetylneuraminate lyase isoform X1 [Chiloscyllium plagiosum]|uniref:N-acetylneuraminate lyase isoform X1 n=1 Tax=Chiloscyllium plagiosum TaxID=36176 RepID=UPI001CB8684D|nr:N-acetylneuraminate lyase isoform X1 [Chiloscyllium plagiosum]
MAIPMNKLCGLVAATFTPMTQENEINISVIGQYVDYLVKVQGIKNIFVNGTTAEGISLTVEERKLLAEEWIKQGKGKLNHVIIHVGSLSIEESKQLAIHAAKCNASGIAVISPFFFKPQSIEALTEFLQEVASAAPSIPFYYYHIPEFTGVSLNVVELLDGIEKRIPTFQGVKFTSSDLLDFGQCVHKFKDRFTLLYGKDELLLSAIVLGASGAVGSTYNYMGSLCNKMLTYAERGDYDSAREHQAVIQEFVGSMSRLGFGVAENKATMTLVSGIPLGPPRLPLLKCNEEKQAKILATLKTLRILI